MTRVRARPLRRLVPGLAAALLVLTGCATKRDVRDLRDDIRDLAARQERALQRLDELSRVRQDSLRENLVQLRGDVARQLLEIQEQLVTVQELAGQSQRNLALLRDQVETRRSAVPAFDPDADTAPGATSGTGVAEEMYNAGLTNFNRGSLTTSRRAFEQFLQAYPNHELAPDALYYLSDILVQENRLQEAIRSFGRIPELHPTSTRVPEALYRIGLLHLELGNPRDARTHLERVVNSYPDSSVAPLARERLRQIR